MDVLHGVLCFLCGRYDEDGRIFLMKEIVRYGIINEYGEFLTTQPCVDLALTSNLYKKGCTIVKLTGQMPEPKRMEKVALFVYQDRAYTYRMCSMMMRTEKQAENWCVDAGFNLVKWPYGEIIEVEEK